MSVSKRLDDVIRTVPDFPKPGIQFKDITPAFSDPNLVRDLAEALSEPFQQMEIDMVAGIESRGFLLGPMMAQRLGCGFTLIRKKGKLPADTFDQSYDLEYGQAVIEMHKDAFDKGKRILIHDDLLATGGTAKASADLVRKAGGQVMGFCFLIELGSLKGRKVLQPYSERVVSIVNY